MIGTEILSLDLGKLRREPVQPLVQPLACEQSRASKVPAWVGVASHQDTLCTQPVLRVGPRPDCGASGFVPDLDGIRRPAVQTRGLENDDSVPL